MLFGAPTHRIEGNLESAARVLELDAHFFYLRASIPGALWPRLRRLLTADCFPSAGIMVMSFNRPDQETSETAFLRSSGGLDVQSLRKVHVVVSLRRRLSPVAPSPPAAKADCLPD